LILADGFSCRTQIEQCTERSALHLAEALKLALDEGPAGPEPHRTPELAIARERRRKVRASMGRAAIGLCLLALGAALTARRLHAR